MKTFHQSMARSITVVMLALLSLGLTTPILSVAPASAATSALDFRNAMRKLWEDHITWTRLYIVEAVAGLPQANTTAQRLLANQDDIGNTVKPFYGDAAGDQLTALLKDHITGAVKILTAAKAGDNAGLKTASDEWYANANDIATFLNKANPQNIPLDQIQSDMKMHLDLTLQEAVDQLKGNFAASVSDYDKVHEEILGMADMLSGGIINQFPGMFSAPPSDAEVNLRLGMRKLWEDHITWTRLYIVEAVAGLPQANTTAQRLLANQDDIGNAVKPFYGDAAGDQLTALLKDHITGAVKILTAAKAGDNAGLKTASDEWYANANDIATFLNKANPQNIPLDQIQSDMKMHLDLTLQEAVDQLKGNYPAAVSDYDKVHEEILGMADMLSGGIINQFPDMFGGAPTVGMPRTGNPQGVPSDVSAALAVIAGLLVTAGWLLRRRSIAS